MDYDAIVIGAGNGGLVAALTLQKSGKKVLLVDKNTGPGGVANSFKRGRFEFDVTTQPLSHYGTPENPGILYEIFGRLGLANKLEMIKIPESFHVMTLDSKEEYWFPNTIEEFINKMEEYVPNSRASIETFWKLAQENHEAILALENNLDFFTTTEFQSLYPNFLMYASYSLEWVLKKIKMPKKARELLATYWFYLASPASMISFVSYTELFYSYLTNGMMVPKLNSYDISLTILEEFVQQGGVAKFLTEVERLLVEENHVVGIEANHETFKAPLIYADLSPITLYSKLLEPTLVPKKARQLTNARTLGPRPILVTLGLNKSCEELGLKHCTYFISHTLNSKKEYERMKKLKGDNLVATVFNNIHADATDKGTTSICLSSMIFSNIFGEIATKENYFDLKNAIAQNFIEIFEQGSGCVIHDAIEEIEVATPMTYARYTGHPDGAIYGYLAKKSDNLLPRILNEMNEQYIKGLYFVGGFGTYLSSPSASYYSGYKVVKTSLKMEVENHDA